MSAREELGEDRYQWAVRTWRNYCRNWEGRRTNHTEFCRRVNQRAPR